MSERSPLRFWLNRLTFLVLALAIIFFQLLPMETTPRRFTGPDLLILFCYVWALRRPEYVPVLSLAGIAFLSDLLFQRPPGLMAALVVVGGEFLKIRSVALRDQGYAIEWLTVSGTLLAIVLANRLVLSLTFVPQPPLGLSLIQLVMTVLTYPLVVFVTQNLFGIRRISAADAEALGNKT